MANYAWGLEKIEVAELAVDGDVGTVWSELGNTELGSASFVEEEGTVTEFFSEESDDPIYIGKSQPGAKVVSFSTNDVSALQIAKLKGGVATGDGTTTALTYTSADLDEELERSVRLTTRSGLVITIVRTKLVSNLDWNFSKEALGKLTVKATVLKPTKAGVKSYTIVKPLEV